MSYRPRTQEELAARVARDIADGSYVNLGIGLPTQVARHIPPEREIIFHSENGILGMGRRAKPGEEDFDLVDAMKVPVTVIPQVARPITIINCQNCDVHRTL